MSEGTTDPDRTWLRFILLAALLPTCWLGMQIVHEFGHVLGAIATGGEVQRVVLHPLTISRTDLGRNPSPLVVVWAGPVLGVLIPLVAWWLVRRTAVAYLLRFFAGFCLVANGAYLGIGPWYPVGDARVILQLSPAWWPLLVFGVVCVAGGFLLWNGEGPRFGFGANPGRIRPADVWGMVLLLTTILVVEFAVG